MSNETISTSIPDDCEENYPHIPLCFINYLRKLSQEPSKDSSFHQAMLNHPKRTFQKLDELFKDTALITKLTPEELLGKADFHENDLDPTKFEAVLGELRTITFLNKNGFSEIISQKMSRKTNEQSADIIAIYNEKPYSIEVATYSRYRKLSTGKNRVPTEDDIAQWAIGRVEDDKKRSQLKKTANEINSVKMMFVFVINDEISVCIHTHDNYLEIAKVIWKEIGRNPDLHVAIVTGRIALGYGADDCIYPNLV